MLNIKPSRTITPALELEEEVQYAIDVTDELKTNTIAAIDYNITNSYDESVDSNFNGGVSHNGAGIISFGILANAVGKYKLEFIVTCDELLPDGITPYEFIFYMWFKVKDI